MSQFRAYRIHHDNNQHRAGIETLGLDTLGSGGVLIRTAYSDINYKDALAGTGRGKILRQSPLIGGVDASGEVAESEDPRFSKGDKVLITGGGLSETRNGGYAEWLRVPAELVVPLPPGLSLFEAMAIGTAGFTAALALHRMEQNGQTPAMGPVVVTGASGGVGSLAVDMLSRRGYEVVAVTGKAQQHKFLRSLGANRVIGRDEITEGQHPLEKGQWGGAIDTVGGETLANLTRSVRPWGNIGCIGLAGGAELHTTVMPFILRGVSLLGVDSTNCPYDLRCTLWQRLGSDLKPHHLDDIVTKIVNLEGLDDAFKELLAGRNWGRTVVALNAQEQAAKH